MYDVEKNIYPSIILVETMPRRPMDGQIILCHDLPYMAFNDSYMDIYFAGNRGLFINDVMLFLGGVWT